MIEKFFNLLSETMMAVGLPTVCCFFALHSNVLLMTAHTEATGLEKLGNTILTPCHYLFAGRYANIDSNGEVVFSNQYEYNTDFSRRTFVASLVAVPSFVAGVCVKTLALVGPQAREHHRNMQLALDSTQIHSNLELYKSLGINLGNDREKQWLVSQGHLRKSGDENNLASDKEGLRAIAALFNEAGIPWWLECGSCLGAYRHGGVIPWDEDIDIAVLQPDFDNVRRALNKLDRTKYIVEDWSSRVYPKCYYRIYVRDSQNPLDGRIDIYHFDIFPEKNQICWIFNSEHSIFMAESWKIRESRFKVPVDYDTVFPLQKAMFDGIEVNVPRDTKKYLQRYYGENLDPAKIYNPVTNQYEKDMNHPYWQREFAH